MADDAGDIQTDGARAAPNPHNAADPSKTHGNVVEHARAAAAKEQDMTLLEGIRLYPKAIAFSIIISTCIVMEGYDVSLINNFCA
jgi:SP family general alpha glucoside:H+ symporter-like MFS transporter